MSRIVTFTSDDRVPTLSQAAEVLGIPVDELDAEFGVLSVAPARSKYAVVVLSDRPLPANSDIRAFANPTVSSTHHHD